MARRRRSFFFDNINKKLLTNTLKNTSDVKDDIDNNTDINAEKMSRSDTQSLIDTEIAALANSAPATLNTLDELAAALGDDANFSTTVTTSLSNRLRIDVNNQSLTTTQKSNATTNLGLGTAATTASSDYATSAQGTKADTAHGWGDHASGGYLTSAFISDKGNAATLDLDDLTASSDEGYYSWGSTQPTNSPGWTYGGVLVLRDQNQNNQIAFGGSTSKMAIRRANSGTYGSWADIWTTNNLTATDKSNYDTAYGWGDHAAAGYTTSGVSLSDLQTYFNRGYIDNHSASNLADGWYTIATNAGNRAMGTFQIWDTASSDHQSVIFIASHHYGTDSSNQITVLQNSYYSGSNFYQIRIKEGSTYDGAALQVYVHGSATNAVNVAIVGGNAQSSGWVIKDWVADGTDPGDVSNYFTAFTEASKITLDNTRGIQTTAEIYAGTQTSQYKVFNEGNSGTVVKLTTSQTTSVTQGNWTTHTWNTQGFIDTDTYTHSTSTNNSRLTVDATGYYQITANLIYNNATSSARNTVRACVFVNGTEQTTTATYDYDRGASYGERSNNKISTILSLTANDYVEIRAYGHNIDGTCSIYGSECELMMMRIK